MPNEKLSIGYRVALIISIVLIVLNLAFWFIIFIEGGFGGVARPTDARRQSDIRQINLAMEMDYDDNGYYLQSQSMPVSVGTYLDPVPTDPGDGPCSSYQWISNMNDPQRYC